MNEIAALQLQVRDSTLATVDRCDALCVLAGGGYAKPDELRALVDGPTPELLKITAALWLNVLSEVPLVSNSEYLVNLIGRGDLSLIRSGGRVG